MKTFIPKIILHNYIFYKGDPTDVKRLSQLKLKDASDIYRSSNTAQWVQYLLSCVGRSVNIKDILEFNL